MLIFTTAILLTHLSFAKDTWCGFTILDGKQYRKRMSKDKRFSNATKCKCGKDESPEAYIKELKVKQMQTMGAFGKYAIENKKEKDGKPISLEMVYMLPQSSLTPLVQRSFFFKSKKACQKKREFYANEFK